MKKFTVRRSKWLRGKGDGYLLNDEGKMCCLGFAVNQICKVPKKKLLDTFRPCDVLESTKETTFTTISYENVIIDKHFVEEAIEVNDDSTISDSGREELLTEIFKENGIKVTFKD